MPDLEDLLAAEAARYDIQHVPVAEIRRRRQRRVMARSGGAVVAVAVLGAAAVLLPPLHPGWERDGMVADDGRVSATGGPTVEGLRTNPDGRALVAAYTGGACDGPASLVVDERGDRVDVAVKVLPRPGYDESRGCILIGIGRTVRAELDAPLGDREVFARGEPIKPFDGKNLVVPDGLPDGFVLRSEAGSDDGWTQVYGEPQPDITGGSCTPGQRSLSVSTRPGAAESSLAPYFRDDGRVQAGDGDARLYSQGAVRYLDLRVGGQPVSLSYGDDCGGAAPSVEELIEIANGLKVLRG